VRPHHLDRLPNPFGASLHVAEALAGRDDLHLPAGVEVATLRERLASAAGVSPAWICLANGIDELHGMIARWRRDAGPTVIFPPADLSLERWVETFGVAIERVERAADMTLPLQPGVRTLPRGATALAMSPNDPTGTILSVQEAVRLTRESALVVVDERHAAYSGRSLVPLVREFDNLIVLQTMETWAGLPGLPLAWAIGPPRLIEPLASFARPAGIARASVVAALATLDDLAAVDASVRRVMAEKSRLFRTVRKLSMVSPACPSWANFILARAERGTAELLHRELAERGIHVHLVANPELPNHLRVSAVSPDATNALKDTLVEIALDL
jgi:histidinol-phosphate aminotransferase